jgi:serine phosphatase RsbU (regulator of sigma subunit)
VSASIGVNQELDQAQLEITRLEISGERSADLARTLQDSLLPPVLICPPWLDAAAVYLPATHEGAGEVLGDFFDLFHTREQWWCAVVGDVCGHGLEAAKVTALARYTVRAEATQHIFPAKILHRLNQALLRQKISDRFLTAACVAVRPAEPVQGSAVPGAQAMISLGGHPPAMLRRADGTVTMIGRRGVLLGVLEDVEPTTEEFALHPGDLLLLYTDGATEARDPAGALLYEEGLAGLLAGIEATSAEQVLTDLLSALSTYTGAPDDATSIFRTDDDTALLVLRVPLATGF